MAWAAGRAAAAGGDAGLQLPLFAGLQVRGAAATGVGNQNIRQPAGIGFRAFPSMDNSCTASLALVADADGHDHLVITVDSSLGLGVVVLDPAARSAEGVAGWLGP